MEELGQNLGCKKSEEGGKSGVSQAFTEWKMVCLSVTLLI